MRLSRCVSIIFLGFCATTVWAAFPGLRYLGEIGNLGAPSDPHTSVRFGKTQVVSTASGVRFQVLDDSGHGWQASLPVFGGIGFTTVWQADFDHNSRPDLLIAAYFPGNGRCLDEVTLSFLLFDDRGRPVPWVIHTRMPYPVEPRSAPAIFTDLNRDGRAELVVTDCTYGDPVRLGEDRRITGIYEAKDATWSLRRPVDPAPYTALVRQSYRFRPQVDQLLTTDPADRQDLGNRSAPDSAPDVRVIQILAPAENCGGTVRLPPVVDGRLRAEGWSDPCEETGRDRIQLSNGTICYGLPTVALDGGDGREIVAESHPEPLLKKIIESRRTVILVGQKDLKRCSPVLLWAR